MKILCLHGYGTSGEIFRQQLSSIISGLREQHEYVFVDGEARVVRSQMAEFIPGDTWAYFDGCWPEDVKPATELIASVIEGEEEPFDGVIGYSQGATIFMSYCLERPKDTPPPVKWAFFIGPNMISSTDDLYHEDDVRAFMNKMTDEDQKDFHSQHISRKAGNLPTTYTKSLERMTPREKEIALEILGEVWLMLKARDFFHVEESEEYDHPTRSSTNPSKRDVPRYFNPVWSDERINFPVVVANGRSDSPESKRLTTIAKGLIEADKVFPLEYDGIHEVPHKKPDVDKIVRAIEKASQLGSLQATLA